jgi:hypothetical protein
MPQAQATFAPYWKQVVMPVAARGYRPQLAEGYGRFLQAPEVAKAVSALLEKELAGSATNPMDSHPPLKARVQKARSLARNSGCEDNRPAVSLFEDLAGLEAELLSKLAPALRASELKPVEWDSAGLEVYVPLWRSEVARLAPALGSFTIYALPDAVGKLAELGASLPDPPGMLLTHEQRTGRAAEMLGHALTLALIDHRWKLHLQPGQFYVESENGIRVNPVRMVEQLRKHSRTAATWAQYCEKNGIGDWALAESSEQTPGG